MYTLIRLYVGLMCFIVFIYAIMCLPSNIQVLIGVLVWLDLVTKWGRKKATLDLYFDDREEPVTVEIAIFKHGNKFDIYLTGLSTLHVLFKGINPIKLTKILRSKKTLEKLKSTYVDYY